MGKLNDELIKGRFYYYHTTDSIKAYGHFINNSWRSRKGYYGLGIYGYAYPPSANKSTYGDIVFRCQVLRFHRIFFANVDLGQQAFTGYSVAMGLNILDEHDVPDKFIKGIHGNLGIHDVLNGMNINDSVLYSDDPYKKCFLDSYDFDGMAYRSHDGYAIVLWNFSPQLLRITGVRRLGDRDFKDIPVGASQSDVEAIFNGTYKASTSSTSSSTSKPKVSTSLQSSPLLSPSVLKFMNRPSLQAHIQKVYDLEFEYNARIMDFHDMVFIESWYIRFNLKHRKSIYKWYPQGVYEIVVMAAYVVAYSCTDVNVPLDPADISSVVGVKRLLKYLLPYSIKSLHSSDDWVSAFGSLGFANQFRVVCSWGDHKPYIILGDFLAGAVWAKDNHNFDVLGKYFDDFKASLYQWGLRYGYVATIDSVLKELNFHLPGSFSAFDTDIYELLHTIESVSSAGIVYK